MKRGDVYWADLAPRSGSEQTGRRPVIIVSHNGFNSAPNWRSVIVVPLTTSRSQLGKAPTLVPILLNSLPASSYALCHQITTLDRAKLIRFIGALDASALAQIEAGIRAALQLPSLL